MESPGKNAFELGEGHYFCCTRGTVASDIDATRGIKHVIQRQITKGGLLQHSQSFSLQNDFVADLLRV